MTLGYDFNNASGQQQGFINTSSSNQQTHGTIAAEPLQVIAQLEQLSYASDTLCDTVESLLRRIEPVTGNLQIPSPDVKTSNSTTAPCLVPIAARIQYQAERIRSVSSILDRILSGMQI